MSSGYLPIFRKVMDNPDVWQCDPLRTKIWFYLLLRARWDSEPIKVGGIVVRRGQFLRSYAQMAEDLKVRKGRGFEVPKMETIRNHIRYLEATMVIKVLPTTHGILITIVNYDVYNPVESLATMVEKPLATEMLPPEKEGKKELKTNTTARSPEALFPMPVQKNGRAHDIEKVTAAWKAIRKGGPKSLPTKSRKRVEYFLNNGRTPEQVCEAIDHWWSHCYYANRGVKDGQYGKWGHWSLADVLKDEERFERLLHLSPLRPEDQDDSPTNTPIPPPEPDYEPPSE